MKTLSKTSFFTVVTFILLSFSSFSQTSCIEANDFNTESPGTLSPYSGFPGYFNDYGSPEYVEENCPVGENGIGIRIQASIDGSLGDGVGYTMTGGINPMPTFLTGKTYHIAGKKLLSNSTIGDYENIVMTIRLSNTINNGLACVAGNCAIVTEKSLMLTAGICESWDEFQFVSPGDFNHLIFNITAESLSGADDLFVVIDDWCIEEVAEACVVEIDWEQIDECGNYVFNAIGDPNTTGYE